MVLNLFLLHNSKAYGWGEDTPMLLVAAVDEAEARNIAENEVCSLGPTEWINPEVTRCKSIGTADSALEKGVIYPESCR